MHDNLNKSDIVIVGGGITGLSAAYIAAKAGRKVTIIESGETFGGLLNTFDIGGSKLEMYYHHFFTHDKELNWLINELGISDNLYYKKSTMGVFKNSMIYNFNTPYDLLKFKPIKLIDKIKFALTSIFLGRFANWKKFENISAYEWLRKFSGKSTTESLWAPMLKIKFGPYASQVPLSWMIGRLRQRINSRKNGEEKLGYLKGSLQLLLDRLLFELKNMDVVLINNSPVDKICFNNGEIDYLKSDTKTFYGRNFIFTIPGIYLSPMLSKEYPKLSAKLKSIEYFGAICVILELKKPLSDIYWLNIAEDNFPFGGIIEHTNLIESAEYNGSHIAYLSRYFAMNEQIASMTKEEIKQMMIEKIDKIHPEFSIELLKNIFIFRTNTAATVCDLNFSQKIPQCKTEISNMLIANMSHVYPDERSVNNSIKLAMEALKLMNVKSSFNNKSNSLSAKIGF